MAFGENERRCGCTLPLSVLNTRNTKLSNQIRLGLLSNSQTCDVMMVVMGLWVPGNWTVARFLVTNLSVVA